MQHLQTTFFPNDIILNNQHNFSSSTPPPAAQQQQPSLSTSTSSCFSIEAEEAAETRIQRMISEHPVIIFSRPSCCMCHVMKKLFATIGIHPTVIELDDDQEFAALPDSTDLPQHHPPAAAAPALFIGGKRVGGLESLVALHVSGHLIPKLVEVGAL